MSASLVGSEMCIRDRCQRVTGRAISTAPLALDAEAALAARNSRSVEASPVSYTHLTLPTICSV
eukprot:10240924-Alexandrium_andersonii.AAC.1